MGERNTAQIKPIWLTLGSGLVILLLGLYGSFLFFGRLDLPRPYDERHPLDRARVEAVDGMGIKIPADIQFVFWTKSPGRPISLEVRQKDGTVSSEAGRIAVHDGGAAPFVDLFIALFSWGLGFAAVLYKKNDRLVRIFFWLCTAFGFSVAVQGETYVLGTAWTTLGPGLGYIALTALGPAFLLHFSLRFPGWTHSRGLFLLYIPPVMLAGFFSSLLAFAYIKASIGAFNFFEGAYFFLRLYMIVYFAAAVLHLARIGRRVQNDDLKAQVQWVFFGLIAGMSPFLLFYELPKALLGRAILSESGTAVFFLIIPAALAIAIIKHRLFDVEVVINRSLVYSLLTISTAGLYLLVVLVLQKLFSSDRTLFSVIAVFAAAAAFHPAQLRIQNLVDRAFFRQKYDYRQAVLAFVRQAQLAAGRADLLDLFLSALRAVLAPEKAGIFVHGQPKGKVVDSRDGTVHCGDDFDESIFSGSSCRLGPFWARRNAVRSGDDVSFAREAALAGDGLELALPLALPGAEICGWLALGRKRSGERFSREDLSLLRTLAGELMTNLDRIRLQEEVIYERASKEKLDEINRQKTEFISTVSHELRTPMASIQGIAELLQSGKIRAGEQREKFLALMVSESGRLSRFLHNVLDFGRIEQEVKSYRLSPIVVQDVVRDAVESFGLLLDSQGASIRIKAPAEPVVIEGDEDALQQALMNLIDNAIKYSPLDKNVEIEILERDADVEIRIKDRGIGIASDDQPRVFERFYRTAEAGAVSPRGAGLGLKIVKHIVEAHRGTILLESEAGRGSVFRLIFPRRGTA